jgi:hypothetical protein
MALDLLEIRALKNLWLDLGNGTMAGAVTVVLRMMLKASVF